MGGVLDILSNLALGLGSAVTFQNLAFCLLGCLLGTLIGVLPGIGAIPTIAMLLPLTFGMSPLTSLIMLAGIYYGAQYGGSTSAILVRMPGETSSIVTCLDGYRMAQQGRAGSALAVAAIASFFAGCVATVFIAAFGPVLGRFATKFSSPEYFSLMTLGLVAAVVLANGSVLKAIGMILLGLLLGLAGTDVNSGATRFTFGFIELQDGIDFVPLALGLFGFAEIMVNLEQKMDNRDAVAAVSKRWPSREEFRASWPAILRGTSLGSLLGILPGGGAVLGSFASYSTEKKLARDPSRFGQGAIEGVAGPEAANNAAAQTSFIPLLTLGIPSTPVMALMMGAMVIQGIAPGTLVMTAKPELFWGMIASMWIANLFLLVINLPMIGIWIKLLHVPYRLLFPCIVVFSCLGVYGVNGSTFDVMLTAVLAVAGYVFAKLGCEAAPLILAFIIGPLMEENLRRAMVISDGNPLVFVQRPISAALLVATLALFLLIVMPQFRRKRDLAFQG
ncbi:MAG: tctA [Noviherbaspirillum sp.]|nr:tctA [Noviherbaspirillum sp.]